MVVLQLVVTKLIEKLYLLRNESSLLFDKVFYLFDSR